TSWGKLYVLLLLADKADGPFNQEDEDMLMNYTTQAFQYIAMHGEIADLAVTDGLTGLNNHRNFQEKLKEQAEMARRYGMALSLLIMDVDNFKGFNDKYGHQTGDAVLKSIASIIKDHIRATDFAARYGGEEFAVIMPETSYNGARILAERLRKKIAGTPFILPDNDKALVTVSIGFASIPENAGDREELIETADKALYFAKQHGRNLSYGFNETNIHEELKESFEGGRAPEIENLASIIDARTPYTKGHSIEVARLATLLANGIGLEESDVESLRIASILHDVGTIHIPERVLNKPGGLTEEERRIIQAHPGLAEMILKKYPHIEQVLPTILYHHERFDGNGYPTGISGDSIPLPARILAIAEAFNAMTSPRSYKKKLTIEEAVEELRAKSGSQFDPQLVKSFIKILKTASFA
ncbi:MAG: diguanylate cyclase, partial [Nitrospirota bacterium]